MKKVIIFLNLIFLLQLVQSQPQEIYLLQESDFNDMQNLYERFNNKQLLPGDLEILEALHHSCVIDSLVIRKTFNDKNGINRLEIKVFDPCCELKQFREFKH